MTRHLSRFELARGFVGAASALIICATYCLPRRIIWRAEEPDHRRSVTCSRRFPCSPRMKPGTVWRRRRLVVGACRGSARWTVKQNTRSRW